MPDAGVAADQRTEALGQRAAVGVGVDADHPHAGRHQELHHELADEAEADDQRELAELRLAPADALHRDRADRAERRVPGSTPAGHAARRGSWDPVQLGVQGVLVARAGHEVADRDVRDAIADLDDLAAERVAERGVRVELGS